MPRITTSVSTLPAANELLLAPAVDARGGGLLPSLLLSKPAAPPSCICRMTLLLVLRKVESVARAAVVAVCSGLMVMMGAS